MKNSHFITKNAAKSAFENLQFAAVFYVLKYM